MKGDVEDGKSAWLFSDFQDEEDYQSDCEHWEDDYEIVSTVTSGGRRQTDPSCNSYVRASTILSMSTSTVGSLFCIDVGYVSAVAILPLRLLKHL